MVNIFGSMIESIKSNWGEILVGITLIIILLLTLSLYGMTFEDINGMLKNKENKKVDTIEIIYEGMTNKFDELCNKDDLEGVCSNLGKGNQVGCNVAKCCVWAKNKNTDECVEGDESGPMFKQDRNGMKYDEYYFLGKKHKIE